MTALNSFNGSPPRTALLIGEQFSKIESLDEHASELGWQTMFSPDIIQANAALDGSPNLRISAVVLDEDVTPGNLCEAVADLKRRDRRLAVIAVTAGTSSRKMIDILSAGAGDCIPKPIVAEQLLHVLRRTTNRAHGHVHEPEACVDSFGCRVGLDSMIEVDPSFRAAWTQALTIARTTEHVLIEGEPGTGRNLLARAIHSASPRARMPLRVGDFTRTSAAEIGPLLFGYERGAFVGAFESRAGLLEECNGATLLLREVDGLPAPIQNELAEALCRGFARRFGGIRSYCCDVRIIAFTANPVFEMAASNALSAKLYANFGPERICLPALRERPEDITLIGREFVSTFRDPQDIRPLEIDEGSLALLRSLDWPGNTRQLLMTLLRAVATAKGHILTPDVFEDIVGYASSSGRRPALNGDRTTVPEMKICTADGHLRSLEDIEADVIRFAIGHYGGRMAEVARRLRIGRSTLYRRLGDLGIDGLPTGTEQRSGAADQKPN